MYGILLVVTVETYTLTINFDDPLRSYLLKKIIQKPKPTPCDSLTRVIK